MAKTVKYGNLFVEVPDNHYLANPEQSKPSEEAITAAKPDEPAKLEEPMHIYRPNDPFQASLDQVRAISNLSGEQPAWIRNTFFCCFVLIPFSGFAAMAVSAFVFDIQNGLSPWVGFFGYTLTGMIVSTPYFIIWCKGRKTRKSQK